MVVYDIETRIRTIDEIIIPDINAKYENNEINKYYRDYLLEKYEFKRKYLISKLESD